MEGLLKSVARSSHSTEGRKISQSSASPSAFHDSHMTVSHVSRDFSSLGMAGLDREDLVAFLVGETFALLVAPCGVMFCSSKLKEVSRPGRRRRRRHLTRHALYL